MISFYPTASVLKICTGATLEEYADGLLSAGHLHVGEDDYTHSDALPSRGTTEEHIRLLDTSRTVINKLLQSPRIQEVSKAMLLHWDFNKRNIFVSPDDPTRITAIIDWQSTSVEPTFVYANDTPDFVMPSPTLSAISEMDEELAAQIEHYQGNEKTNEDYWICRQTFEIIIQASIPALAAARTMDETLLRLFRHCHSSWREGAAVLRQELIELFYQWSELCLPGSCPYQPSAADLAKHTQQWQEFETVQMLKLFLVRALDSTSEGWVPSESWESAKESHKAAFEQWMDTVRESDDPEMNEDRGRKLWPWNEI